MKTYYERKLEHEIQSRLSQMPAVAIIGPRQCGKSTLAKELIKDVENAVYLDLERPSDLAKLNDAEAFLSMNKEALVCLDEIQRKPELFPLLRSLVDETGKDGQFLILGSASPDLLRQSSESLAGRISYHELTPFILQEIDLNFNLLWQRGGFPKSLLAENDSASYLWRQDFIQNFLQRDIPGFGFRIPPETLYRFWQMTAHVQGQILNTTSLGTSLGVSYHTIRSYVEMLEQTFMLRVLKPYYANVKKRLVKSPKVYIRDSGILHALLNIETHNDLYSHPVYGPSWETFVIEQILGYLPQWQSFFYRTATGVEIDLILQKGRRRIAIEAKASRSPKIGKGFKQALIDLEIDEAWIAAPVDSIYPYEKGIRVGPPWEIVKKIVESK